MSDGPGFQASRYHLLIVDDEKAMLDVLRLVLEPMGYQLSFCHKPVEALEKIKGGTVNLLLSDFHMPEMNGLVLIQKCRAANWQGPIAVMSGRIQAVPQQALEELGVCTFLEKPFSPILLGNILRQILSRVQN